MVLKRGDASRSGATPGWAWAVAGLCGLLLIPVALEDHHLVHTVTPLHLAGPANRPASLDLAGHSSSRHHTQSGGTAGIGTRTGAAAGGASPSAHLDLQNPSTALSSGNGQSTGANGTDGGGSPFGAAAATGSISLGNSPGDGAALVALGPSGSSGARAGSGGLAWSGLAHSSAGSRQSAARASMSGARTARSRAAGAPLIRPRPVTPKPRFWAKHPKPGPASRVRRRLHPRFYGFYVITGR